MAISLGRLRGGVPISRTGNSGERRFVIDNDFDKNSDGDIVAPTEGSSGTLYLTRSLIQNSLIINSFTFLNPSSVSQPGGDERVVRVEGEEGSQFQLSLSGFSGESGIQTIPESGVLDITLTASRNSSTNSRTISATLIPSSASEPETILSDTITQTIGLSQPGVPATLSVWTVQGWYSTDDFATETQVGEGTVSVNYNEGDVITFRYRATLMTGGNTNAFTNMSGFLIVPSVHGGDANNYTWTLQNVGTGTTLSNGNESGVNRPTYQYHLRESSTFEGQSHEWRARIDTTGLGTAGSTFTGDFPLYGRIQGTSTGHQIRVNYVQN